MVGEGGFEPPKALPADLQSVPFGHSGIPPYSIAPCGAGGRTRTPDLLITNQLLYRLSYTSILPASPVYRSSNLTPERLVIIANRIEFVNLYFSKIKKYCPCGSIFSPVCLCCTFVPTVFPPPQWRKAISRGGIPFQLSNFFRQSPRRCLRLRPQDDMWRRFPLSFREYFCRCSKLRP